MTIYFAGPLFSQGELKYNSYLAQKIRTSIPDSIVYLPQENEAINDKTTYADSKMIALADTSRLKKSKLLVAILDGITIDSGVASEIGIAYANKIPIIGLYTDTRQQGATNKKKLLALEQIAENQFHYLNLYTVGLIKLNGLIVTNETDFLYEIESILQNNT